MYCNVSCCDDAVVLCVVYFLLTQCCYCCCSVVVVVVVFACVYFDVHLYQDLYDNLQVIQMYAHGTPCGKMVILLLS